MSVTTAIADRLLADVTLTGLLATYRGVPAIVQADGDTVPEDVTPPFVVIPGADQDDPFDTKTRQGRDVLRVVRCYTEATGSLTTVEMIAERVRTLLHRLPVALADGAHIAECTGPIVAPTDASFYGRQVTVRITSLATA